MAKPHEILQSGGIIEPVNISYYLDAELSTHREITNIYVIAIFLTALFLLISLLI